jgi:tRNA(Ile)-lysidine synthase
MSTDSEFLELLDSGLSQALVPNGSTLIVAFSGGPDSSALLAGLAALRERQRLSLVAVHVNHQIRPALSDRDQSTAQRIAESLNVTFQSVVLDIPAQATATKISIELAARSARYGVMAKAVADHQAFGVVTGHTRDDQAETVLLHAARGSGLKGISGMDHNSILRIPEATVELRVLRPMLDTPHTECLAYCDNLNIEPAIDESNNSRDYTRNKIRLDVLPALNESIPEASQALSRLAKNATDDLEIIDWIVDRHITVAREASGSYSRFTVEGLPSGLISRMLMKGYESHVGHLNNLERIHVSKMSNLLERHSGTSIELPNNVEFYVDKKTFGFRSTGDDDCPFPMPATETDLTESGTFDLGNGLSIKVEIVDRPAKLEVSNPYITFGAPDLVSQSLKLRNRKNGDRFQPLGMEPRVKLQDFFVGAGVPERWRDRIPVVDSDRGIIWIVGYRLAEWAKVSPEHTQVTRFTLTDPNNLDKDRAD